jgi:UDP-2-acetamido-3-amino-2,3-dideoxy-glucuronate N-acetyltransferase
VNDGPAGPVRIHPTAEIEDGVEVGAGTAIWAGVHVRSGARIGASCIVGERTYVAGGVIVGDLVKINAMAYLCAGVTVERGVMIAAGVVFTNDRYPRATTPELDALLSSDVGDDTLPTVVREGATVGAGAIVGCGLEIGRFALVGMGAVVTRSVPDFHLVVGNPARSVAVLCRCGEPVVRFRTGASSDGQHTCPRCARGYSVAGRAVTES